jgi:hypothetical protein
MSSASLSLNKSFIIAAFFAEFRKELQRAALALLCLFYRSFYPYSPLLP